MTAYAFHPEALSDLIDIWEFIAENNINAADHVIEEIHTALRSLASAPGQGRHRFDLTSRPLRFWRVRNYLIAYMPDERPLVVVAILHGRRNPRVMAAILRDRD